MADELMSATQSGFDFGPLANEYDRWYQTPAGRAHDRIQKEDVRRLLRSGHAGESLLDVGCGTGHWSGFFTEMGYQVTGVDIAAEMIAVARAAVPAGSFHIADARKLPVPDGSFDVVACMATLEFIADAAAAVREMVRCVKPGGRLLVGALNRLAPLNQDRLAKARQPYASGHLFEPNELRRLLGSYGRVRLRASSPAKREGRSALHSRVVHRLPWLTERLKGAFLVAEVRL